MILDPLYHWAPSARRDSILTGGLQPFSAPTVCSGALAYPHVCLGPTPSGAWSLSGDMDWMTEIDEWDLWQVRLADTDSVRVRAEFGPLVRVLHEFQIGAIGRPPTTVVRVLFTGDLQSVRGYGRLVRDSANGAANAAERAA